MAISVDWHNPERTALRFTLTGMLHVTETRNGRIEGDALLETVSRPVVIVFDFRKADSMALGALSQLRPQINLQHHRNSADLMITVGLNTFLRTLAQIVMRLNPQLFAGRDIRFVRTLEEADLLIRAYVAKPDN